MALSERLKRIQELPLTKRKIIFWSIIIILGLILFTLWGWNVKRKIKSFQTEKFLKDMNLPKLQEDIENLPKPELPKFNIEENLKEIEETKPSTNSQN